MSNPKACTVAISKSCKRQSNAFERSANLPRLGFFDISGLG